MGSNPILSAKFAAVKTAASFFMWDVVKMHFSYLFRRLFHREEWKQALACEEKGASFWALCKATAQAIHKNYAAIAECTEAIRENSHPTVTQPAIEKVSECEKSLALLLPFANAVQRKAIADAQSTARYARSIVPKVRERTSAEICYYSVYIPTLDGRFYYLATEEFQAGDIVAIPFGREDKIIFGVVQETFCQDYRKMPLPLWKMKYIDSKAPEVIAEEYRRQTENAGQT